MEILKQIENIALSNKDLLKIVDGKANIIIYSNIYKYRSIDDLINPYGAAFILFQSRPHYGHWCLLFRTNDRKLEFFNPYGGYPDDSLDYINSDFKKKSYQDKPYLSKLLLKSPYDLEYNEFDFQKEKNDIKTCGRHCAMRLICRYLNIYEYKDFLDKIKSITGLNYDQIVTLFTINYGTNI